MTVGSISGSGKHCILVGQDSTLSLGLVIRVLDFIAKSLGFSLHLMGFNVPLCKVLSRYVSIPTLECNLMGTSMKLTQTSMLLRITAPAKWATRPED